MLKKILTPPPPVCISQTQLGKCPIQFLTPSPVGEIFQGRILFNVGFCCITGKHIHCALVIFPLLQFVKADS